TNPNRTEIVHTSQAGAPTVAEMAPIEKSTRAGTPAATKNASFQSMARRIPWTESSATLVIAFPMSVPSLNFSAIFGRGHFNRGRPGRLEELRLALALVKDSA